ncbi:hypothetical protein KAI32_02385 [Candidatus Pacearchaeota archaeon]|nr:hypothetical protein [Candidatus Pacearchaeota archaeon]
MNILLIITISLIGTFVGFAIGRFGDKYGGHLNAPHHWIYGLVLIVVGIIYIHNWIGMLSLSFGVGHFVSDLDDFLHMRIWGVDEPHEWKFWSIK